MLFLWVCFDVPIFLKVDLWLWSMLPTLITLDCNRWVSWPWWGLLRARMQPARLQTALPVTCSVLLLALKGTTVSIGLKTLRWVTATLPAMLVNIAGWMKQLWPMFLGRLGLLVIRCVFLLTLARTRFRTPLYRRWSIIGLTRWLGLRVSLMVALLVMWCVALTVLLQVGCLISTWAGVP